MNDQEYITTLECTIGYLAEVLETIRDVRRPIASGGYPTFSTKQLAHETLELHEAVINKSNKTRANIQITIEKVIRDNMLLQVAVTDLYESLEGVVSGIYDKPCEVVKKAAHDLHCYKGTYDLAKGS